MNGSLSLVSPPKIRWSGVSVIVIRDISHVVIDAPGGVAELSVGH
jgi:hypothetical protein